MCLETSRRCRLCVCAGILEYMYFRAVGLHMGLFWVAHETVVYLVSLCV